MIVHHHIQAVPVQRAPQLPPEIIEIDLSLTHLRLPEFGYRLDKYFFKHWDQVSPPGNFLKPSPRGRLI